MDKEKLTFENEDDIISVDSIYDTEKIESVRTELLRGFKLYDERFMLRKKRKGQLKPLYEDSRKKKNEFEKIAIYKLFCHTQKAKDSHEIDYPECKHTGTIIIDRDILSKDEHVAFLAQPKIRGEPIPRKFKMHCRYVKRYLPNCTTRIESLAVPDRKRVLLALEQYAKRFSARQIDHLTKLILNEETDFTDIERAIKLRLEEKKKKLVRKAKLLRESARIKRKIIKLRKEHVCQVAYAIFEIMKPFLMQEHKVEMTPGLKVLSEVLECKIRQFTGMTASSELVDKFLKDLAKNLAIWMEKFTSNFGFESFTPPPDVTESQVCPCERQEFRRQLPIDDYIEMSEETEIEYEGEEYFGWDELGEEGGIGEDVAVRGSTEPVTAYKAYGGEEEGEASADQAEEEEAAEPVEAEPPPEEGGE